MLRSPDRVTLWTSTLRKLENGARRAFPHRRVRRTVQGVSLTLPWSHRLPDHAARFPKYGQNLVALARAIACVRDAAPERWALLDIGANVGDSALQAVSYTHLTLPTILRV